MSELVHEVGDVFSHALMITGFVAVMMLVIEYTNVLSKGVWMRHLASGRLRQYLLAAVLGAIPGCLGSFIVVSLYAHRCVSIGAVVAAMIATLGDETFVLLAMVPQTAFWMMPVLALLGLFAGWATDIILPKHLAPLPACQSDQFPLHEKEHHRAWAPFREIKSQWKSPTPHRAMLTVALTLFFLGLATGQIGHGHWDWVHITLLVVAAIGIFIAATVSNHFLDEHLWDHVLRRHVPRIFLWTIGALAAIHSAEHFVDIDQLVQGNLWIVMVVAVLVGIIPESGPHLVFVTLFAAGKIPLSVLLASSIVQDGHGMIPLLAHSRRDFFVVKSVNVLLGLVIGAVLLMAGY